MAALVALSGFFGLAAASKSPTERLVQAVQQDDLAAVQAALRDGGDPNALVVHGAPWWDALADPEDRIPFEVPVLVESVERGKGGEPGSTHNVAIIKSLLDSGADPNAPTRSRTGYNSGITALSTAKAWAQFDGQSVVQLLQSAGATR